MSIFSPGLLNALIFCLACVFAAVPAFAEPGPPAAAKKPPLPVEKVIVDCSECAEPITANAPQGVRYATVTVYLKSMGTELGGFSVSLVRKEDGNSFKTRETDPDGAATFYGVPIGEYLALLHRTGGRLRPNMSTSIGDIVIKFPAAPAAQPVKSQKPETP